MPKKTRRRVKPKKNGTRRTGKIKRIVKPKKNGTRRRGKMIKRRVGGIVNLEAVKNRANREELMRTLAALEALRTSYREVPQEVDGYRDNRGRETDRYGRRINIDTSLPAIRKNSYVKIIGHYSPIFNFGKNYERIGKVLDVPNIRSSEGSYCIRFPTGTLDEMGWKFDKFDREDLKFMKREDALTELAGQFGSSKTNIMRKQRGAPDLPHNCDPLAALHLRY